VKRSLSPAASTRYGQIVAREVILVAAITLVALLLQAGGYEIPVLGSRCDFGRLGRTNCRYLYK
jgi:hypothetical protein